MSRFILFTSLVCLVFFVSCADQYKPYRSRYAFKSPDGAPAYASLDYWAAHPWKQDPADSIPAPLRGESRDTAVDVFFLHPTTYTSLKKMNGQNAQIDDPLLNAKTDYTTILYQASAFNQHARVFAPRYRQAHIQTFFMTDKERAAAAFALAYEDLKKAFVYYLEHWNNGRPILIAAHSQGSLLAEQLLKEFFEDKPLQQKLVAAYVIGWPVPKSYFTKLPMCADSLKTGCICSWRTFRRNYVPLWLRNEKGNAFVTNPLTWDTTGQFVSRKQNKGSILKNFNKVYTQTTDAQISNGLLYTRKPKFPWSFLFLTKNYHVGDINLYYINLRENVGRRIAEYLND